VAPSVLVTVVETGLGMWTVPVDPDGVLTSTEVSHDGISMVAVPPLRVTTWERTWLVSVWMVSVAPPEVTMVTEVGDGVETGKLPNADGDSETE
jgi:hypothetical protein